MADAAQATETTATESTEQSQEQQLAGEQQPAGDETLDMDTITSMLEFDAFAVKPEEAGETATTMEGEASTSAAGQSSENPEQTDEVTTSTETLQVSPEVQELMRQLADANTQLQQMQQQQQTQTQQQQQQQQSQQTQDPYAQHIPEYSYELPEQLIGLIESEDAAERVQGIKYLAQGISRNVHRQMLEQMGNMMAAYVPQQLQQHSQLQELRNEIRKDFYGTYKEFDTPDIRGIVPFIIPQVMQEKNMTEWSPELRDAIADRVRALLKMPATQQQQQVQQQQAPILDQGSRGPATPVNDIMATLF